MKKINTSHQGGGYDSGSPARAVNIFSSKDKGMKNQKEGGLSDALKMEIEKDEELNMLKEMLKKEQEIAQLKKLLGQQ